MSTQAFRTLLTGLVAVLVLALAACEPPRTPDPDPPADPDDEHVDDVDRNGVTYTSVEQIFDAYPEADAAAIVEPVGDGQARGYVTFEQRGEQMHVTVNLEGIEPGRRGFHIHEQGSCEPGPDGDAAGAAGGHFAPFDRPHGGPDDPPQERHAGDFGNLDVGDDGTVRTSMTSQVIALEGDANVIGRAVIVHAEEDDLETQPTGDAGARIGCGIITAR